MPLMYSPAGAWHPWTVNACLYTETPWVRGANAGVEGKEMETTSTSGMASWKSLPCRDVKNKPVTTKGFGKHFNLSSLYCPLDPSLYQLLLFSFLSREASLLPSGFAHCSLRFPRGRSSLLESCACGPGLALIRDCSKHTFFPWFS